MNEFITRQELGELTAVPEQKTVRGAVLTDRVAVDGMMVLPEFCETADFLKNPVVLTRHGKAKEHVADALTIGRCVGLFLDGRTALVGETQFADTRRGQEYAYLYGLNPDGIVFMRGWSARVEVLARAIWPVREVQQRLGNRFNLDDLVPDKAGRRDRVPVATRTRLVEYSVVDVGADRDALTRAMDDGIELAGEIALRMDLRETQCELGTIRDRNEEMRKQVEMLTRQMQALARDGAAAARRGNSAELLEAVRDLRRSLNQP